MTDIFMSIFWIVLFALYVTPSIIAMTRRLRNTDSIMVLNVLLGWTFVGWVVALCWASAGTAAIGKAPK